MPYPSSADNIDTTMQGTTLFTGDDHALNHRNLGSAVNALEKVLGTTPGTNLLSNVANPNDQILVANFGGSVFWTLTGGTMNKGVLGSYLITSGTLGTPAIDVINARNSGTALGFGNSIYPSEGSVADSAGGTLTVNAQAAQVYYSVMGTAAGNRTIATPGTPTPYQQLTFAFKTSGSANGTLIWSSSFRLSQDFGTPTLGTGIGWNYFNWRYNGIDSKWDFLGQVLNLI